MMPDLTFRFKGTEYVGGKRPNNTLKVLICEQIQNRKKNTFLLLENFTKHGLLKT